MKEAILEQLLSMKDRVVSMPIVVEANPKTLAEFSKELTPTLFHYAAKWIWEHPSLVFYENVNLPDYIFLIKNTPSPTVLIKWNKETE